jgi:hypothetical protein
MRTSENESSMGDRTISRAIASMKASNSSSSRSNEIVGEVELLVIKKATKIAAPMV